MACHATGHERHCKIDSNPVVVTASVLVPAIIAVHRLVDVPLLGPLVFRGLVNDRFLTALAAFSLLAAMPMVCAAHHRRISWWRSSLSSPGSQRSPYAWRRPRCAFVADEGGAVTAAAL